MNRLSITFWEEFEGKLKDLATRIIVDPFLEENIYSTIDKVNRAITLNEPFSEHLEMIKIITDPSYQRNIMPKISKEDYNFLLSLERDYFTLVNLVRREDNELIQEIEGENSNIEVTDKNIPQSPDIDFDVLYNDKDNKGNKDYLY